jgi:hypothetical protein
MGQALFDTYGPSDEDFELNHKIRHYCEKIKTTKFVLII